MRPRPESCNPPKERQPVGRLKQKKENATTETTHRLFRPNPIKTPLLFTNQQLFGTLTPTVPCAFGTTYSTKLRDPQRNTGST